MLFIILGHNKILCPNNSSQYCFLYSFHIFIFFIIPFFYNKMYSFSWDSFKKIVFTNYKYFNLFFLLNVVLFIFYNGHVDVKEVIKAWFFPTPKTLKDAIGFTFIWFIPAFVSCSLIRVCYNNIYTVIVRRIILLIAIVAGCFYSFQMAYVFPNCPFALAIGFFYFGYGETCFLLCRECRFIKKQSVSLVLFVIVCLLYFLWYRAYEAPMYVISYFAFFVLFAFRKVLSEYRFLRLVGTNSLFVYLLHIYIYNLIVKIYNSGTLFYGVVVYLVTTIVALIFSYILSCVLKRLSLKNHVY